MCYRTISKAWFGVSILLCFLLNVNLLSGETDAKPTVKVAKHIAEGSTVTQKQMEDWFKEAKDNLAPWITLEQVGGVTNTAGTNDGRVAGAINVYGTSLTATPPGNPGSCHDQDYVEMGPGAAMTTLKHEITAHWFGGYPDNATTEHGTPTGTYPGYDNYTGYDTDGDNDTDDNDTKNIAFPGTGRTGHDIDPNQGKRVQDNAKKWLKEQEAKKTGKGKDCPDDGGDAPHPLDLTAVQVYCWGPGPVTLFLKGLVQQVMPGMTIVGFLIESDQYPATGDPLTGADYRLKFNFVDNSTTFEEFAGGVWLPVPAGVTTFTNQYQNFDAPYDPILIGVELSISETAFVRRGPSDVLSIQGFATDPGGAITDYAPNGFESIDASATPVMLSGRVTLEGAAMDLTGMPVAIEFRSPGITTPIYTANTTLEDADGCYFVQTPLSIGMYEISTKFGTWLRQTSPPLFLSLDSNWCNFNLPGGDLNSDGVIDAGDLNILAKNWGMIDG